MPKTRRAIVSREWVHQQRVRFLETAFHHYPSALASLRNDVWRDKRISAGHWASQFDLEGTWVEQYAADVIGFWELEANSSVDPQSPGQLFPPEPRRNEAPLFFAINWRLPNTGSRGAFLDRATLVAELQADVGHLFAGWLEARLRDGSLIEILEPTDLDLKIECAVLYYFGRMSPQDIVDRKRVLVVRGSSMMAGSRVTVNRWLQQVSEVLSLPRRKPGSRAKTGERPLVARSAP